jgi:hypothetical protein
MDGTQSLSGCYGEVKNLVLLLGIEPRLLGLPAHSLVAVPADLHVDELLLDQRASHPWRELVVIVTAVESQL